MELQDFIDVEKKQAEIKVFLVHKSIDYCATSDHQKPQYSDLLNEYDRYKFNLEKNEIVVSFSHYISHDKEERYDIVLPLDIVFNPDFAEMMRIRRINERNHEEEVINQQETRRKADEKLNMEILKGILRNYPEASKQIINEHGAKK